MDLPVDDQHWRFPLFGVGKDLARADRDNLLAEQAVRVFDCCRAASAWAAERSRKVLPNATLCRGRLRRRLPLKARHRAWHFQFGRFQIPAISNSHVSF
jgi:hypothetical protein